MAAKKYPVTLSEEERETLKSIIGKGSCKAGKIKRCNMLLLSDKGFSDHEISRLLECYEGTVEKLRKRFVCDGLEFALNEKPRPGQPPKIDGKAEAYLIALAYSEPPEGRKQWTMQLLADHLVAQGVVDSISDEAIRLHFKKKSKALVQKAMVYRRDGQ